MVVYRITKCAYNKDLTGAGAAINGGRWNSKGVFVLYTSATPSLALLETVVHLSVIPKESFCLATIRIPEDKIAELEITDLPFDWAVYPAPGKLKAIGDKFISENKYLAMKIPSAVVPVENNILINPRHPDFEKVRLLSSEEVLLDARLKA